MSSFVIIIRKGPYGKDDPRNWIGECQIQTLDQAVSDVAEGQVDAEDIHQIIEIDPVAGTSRDVTELVANKVYDSYDKEGYYPWDKMREWLEYFKLDTDDLKNR